MTEQIEQSKKNQLRFPVQRVKKIVQENQDVGKINNVVPFVLTKSLELFMSEILTNCQNKMKEKNLGKATPGLLYLIYLFRKTVLNESKFDFMKEFASKLPDFEETQKKKKKQQHSDEEIEKKSRRPKRVKRNRNSDYDEDEDDDDE